MEGYYIVRCDKAGVFAGNIKSRDRREVTMTDARRIWHWSGALTLSQMALEGVKFPDDCQFSVAVDELLLLEAIEIIRCTAEAETSIRGVKEWKL